MAPLPLLLIAFLFAVARMVEPLECPSCASYSATCTGPNVNCSTDQDSCIVMSITHSLRIGQGPMSGGSRSCAVAANNVNGSFMFDFGDEGYLNFETQLCSEGYCNLSSSYIYLEPFWNGKYCPKCYKPGYSSCEDNGTVSCYGDFVQCATISGRIKEGTSEIPFEAKGCAKGPVDKLKVPLTVVSDPYSYTLSGMSFRPASGAWAAMRRIPFSLDGKHLGPQVAFFLPCLLGIFAGKIFS